MADIKSLTRYVKAHPYHFVERWRLVKKIYKASDYELALVHLLVLDDDWEPKASLTRYLAATYSRLDREDDAVKTLEKGIVAWPKDLEMFEQLAMVYQNVGREEDAIKTLEKITKIDPNYRLPQKAKETLRHEKLKGHQAHTNVYVGLTEETVCARCGAQNTDEVTQCWQCKANLDIFGEIVNQPQSQHGTLVDADPEPPETLHYITLALKCLIGVFTVFGGYQTYQALAQSDIRHSGYTISTTFAEWIGVEMVMTRIVLGILLLVLCPFLLQGAYRVAGGQSILSSK